MKIKGGFTGTRKIDDRLANDLAGLAKKPAGFTWHHVEDGHTMMLVPKDLHDAVPHTGGHAIGKPGTLETTMPIPFDETGPPIEEGAVAAFEQALPGRLPADYRAFLLAQNGGEPASNWWPPEVSDADFGLDLFYEIDAEDDYASLTEVRETFRGRVPDEMLAVASDNNGNQICLSLRDRDHGTVWFYDHELEVDEGEEPYPDLLTPLTDSFTTLIDTLEPEPAVGEMIARVDAARAR